MQQRQILTPSVSPSRVIAADAIDKNSPLVVVLSGNSNALHSQLQLQISPSPSLSSPRARAEKPSKKEKKPKERKAASLLRLRQKKAVGGNGSIDLSQNGRDHPAQGGFVSRTKCYNFRSVFAGISSEDLAEVEEMKQKMAEKQAAAEVFFLGDVTNQPTSSSFVSFSEQAPDDASGVGSGLRSLTKNRPSTAPMSSSGRNVLQTNPNPTTSNGASGVEGFLGSPLDVASSRRIL